MKSKYRLKKNYQYNYVYKHAKSVADKNFVMLFCKSNNPTSQAGFSISKKFGNAVRRNKIRRQLKAAVSVFMPNVKPYYNIVFIPRKSESYVYSDVVDSVTRLFDKSGLLV